MPLGDYASALKAAYDSAPSYGDLRQQSAQTAVLEMQPQLIQAQIGQAQAQAVRVQQETQRAAEFQTALSGLGAKPTPQAYRELAVRFPQFHAAIDGAAKGLDMDQSKALVRQLAPIQALIQRGNFAEAAKQVKRHMDIDPANIDETDQELYDSLTSNDPKLQSAAGGIVYGLLNQLNPETAATNIGKRMDAQDGYTLAPGGKRFDADNNLVASAEFAPDRFTLSPGETRFNGEGGGPASSGGGRDVTRLINTDAGGGYVPDSVQTLGQFVTFGKSLNQRGAKSSSAGTYQINGTTMAEFAPKAIGSGWRDAPFSASTQEAVGKAIFDWTKRQANPAVALKNRWVSLTGDEAKRLVQGDWEQARGLIAQKETGGSAGASAAAGPRGGAVAVASGGAKPNYQIMTPAEVQASGLDPNVRYQRSPDGQITALGGQSKARLKQIPVPAVKGIQDDVATLRKVDNALKLVSNNPDAFGFWVGHTPDFIRQRVDSKGNPGRIAIGEIAGVKIHDVSGAAVTASESPRFTPYIPAISDDPKTIRQKLEAFKQNLVADIEERRGSYSEDNGYRPYKSRYLDGGVGGQGSARPAAPSGFRVLRVRPK